MEAIHGNAWITKISNHHPIDGLGYIIMMYLLKVSVSTIWVIDGTRVLTMGLRKATCLNTLRPRQNGRYFPDDIFKCIFLNENVWISFQISLKFVSEGPTNKKSWLVHIMVWRQPGDKPLSEPMIVRLLTHICGVRPQWVNKSYWVAFKICIFNIVNIKYRQHTIGKIKPVFFYPGPSG